MDVQTLGIDLAKSVFQVHGVAADGSVVVRKKLRRAAVLDYLASLPPCLVGMEACSTAYYWAREISKLGHEVRLMPPTYVKPYVKRQKNDAADAEAICEAVTRPNMRFVPIKSAERQAVMTLHRSRDLLIRQRTMLLNAVRGHLAEFGLIAAQGPRSLWKLIEEVRCDAHENLPALARTILLGMADQIVALNGQIGALERELADWLKRDEPSRRLMTIPGIGYISATAIAATVADASAFSSGRQFAAWVGLTPRQNSSGGRTRLGRISKKGNSQLRRLLVAGATALLRHVRTHKSATGEWVRSLAAKKPARLVTVALANKTARIVWAVLAKGETYQPRMAA